MSGPAGFSSAREGDYKLVHMYMSLHITARFDADWLADLGARFLEARWSRPGTVSVEHPQILTVGLHNRETEA